MCGEIVYFCKAGQSCLHPAKWTEELPTGVLVTRFPQFNACPPARAAFENGLPLPIPCQTPTRQTSPDAEWCYPCQMRMQALGIPLEDTTVPAGSIYVSAAAGGSQGSGRSTLPVSTSGRTTVSNQFPANSFMPTMPYVKGTSITHKMVPGEMRTPNNLVQTRTIPTGQVIPKYFDMTIRAEGDSVQNRYRRGLNTSNNEELPLPLVYETRAQYVQRQQQNQQAGLRPNLTRAVFDDEYRAWSSDTSTSDLVLTERPNDRAVCQVQYHPPYPLHAMPNNGRDTKFITAGMLIAVHSVDLLSSDPVSDAAGEGYKQKIRKRMDDAYGNHPWCTHGSFNPPPIWLNASSEELERLKSTKEFQIRYFWARVQAFMDAKPLPYETRAQFISRQLLHRHNGQHFPDVIHGWNYLYSEYLKDAGNRNLFAFDDESDAAVKTLKIWSDREANRESEQARKAKEKAQAGSSRR